MEATHRSLCIDGVDLSDRLLISGIVNEILESTTGDFGDMLGRGLELVIRLESLIFSNDIKLTFRLA